MRVSIVTVFKSNNPGSYWQAKTLYESVIDVLPGGSKQNEVKFYDAGTRKLGKDYLLAVAKNIVMAKFHKASFLYRNHKAIENAWNSLPNTKDLNWVNESDVVIFGSDEIWNFDRKEISDYPVLVGKGIDGPRKVAIAVSAGNTSADTLKKNGFQDLLKEFSYIAVRDIETKRAVEECTVLPVDLVCDPTLNKISGFYPDVKRPVKGKYIALYGLDVPKEYVQLISDISKKMNLPVVSLARWYDFCADSVTDESVFSYYKNAESIICMTFHGTAFAINFEKPFVVLTCGRKKIKALLEETGLMDRCIDGMDAEEAARVLNSHTDYTFAKEVILNKGIGLKKSIRMALKV